MSWPELHADVLELAGHHWSGLLGGRQVELRADSYRPMEYLQRFADPCVGDRPVHRVVHVRSAALCARLADAAGGVDPARVREVFSGDHYEFLANASVFRKVGDDPHWVLRSGETVLSVTTYGARDADRYPIRLLRELLIRQGEQELILHASSVATVDGRHGIIFVGPSGSGKTTLALLLAEQAGMALLGNDYLFLAGGMAAALPVVYRIGFGTASASPALRDWLPQVAELRPGIVVGGERVPGAKVLGSPLKYEVAPRVLADRFGTTLCSAALVDAIVLATLHSSGHAVEVCEIGRQDAGDLVHRELRVPVGAPWTHPWVAPRAQAPEVLAAEAVGRLNELLERTPLFAATVALGALLDSPVEIAAELAGVLRPRPVRR